MTSPAMQRALAAVTEAGRADWARQQAHYAAMTAQHEARKAREAEIVPPDGPAPFSVGDRVIERDSPFLGSLIVMDISPNRAAIWRVEATRNGTRPGDRGYIGSRGPASAYTFISADWQEPPVPTYRSAESEVRGRYNGGWDVPDLIEAARAADSTIEALEAQIADAEAWLAWTRDQLVPLDPERYRERLACEQARVAALRQAPVSALLAAE